MDVIVVVALLIAFSVCAGIFGVDSRPTIHDRPEPWFGHKHPRP
jgi:hypothetical protein